VTRPVRQVPSALELSDDAHLVGAGTFGRVYDIKLHPLPLPQSAEALALNGTVVDKDVLTVITGDKPVALGLVEPLDRAFEFRHCDRTSFGRFGATVRIASPASGGPVRQRHESDRASLPV